MKISLEKDHILITILWCEEGGTELKIYEDRCELWETPQYGGSPERLEGTFKITEIRKAIELGLTYT